MSNHNLFKSTYHDGSTSWLWLVGIAVFVAVIGMIFLVGGGGVKQ